MYLVSTAGLEDAQAVINKCALKRNSFLPSVLRKPVSKCTFLQEKRKKIVQATLGCDRCFTTLLDKMCYSSKAVKPGMVSQSVPSLVLKVI